MKHFSEIRSIFIASKSIDLEIDIKIHSQQLTLFIVSCGFYLKTAI